MTGTNTNNFGTATNPTARKSYIFTSRSGYGMVLGPGLEPLTASGS